MSGVNCPSREELVAFHLGTLPEATAETVISHLSECASCQAMLETFDEAVDTLVARLRHPAGDDERLHEPQCRAAVARAEAMAGRFPASADASIGAAIESAALGELGEYQLLEKLGQGGMGAVYKARHTKLKRIVALKVLPKNRMEDESAIVRFEREMEAVGALDHPNIVRATDAREIEGTWFLVMEYVEGEDLSKLVRRLGPLGIADACELVRQAALGLQDAHEHGLVHRDIKPSNLMLNRSGQVKILDLGLALLEGPRAQEVSELTDAGQMMGTLDYMAPEQGTDSHDVDIRADIWSLGATLYKLLCGYAPFSGEEYNTPVKKMKALATEAVPPISERGAELPDELAAILNRMLAREPADRFSTPAEVVAALEPFTTDSDLSTLSASAERLAEGDAEHEQSRVSTDECRLSAEVDTHPNAAPTPQFRPLACLIDRRRLRIVLVATVPVFLVALGVVIWINRTKLEVPDGSQVTIGKDGSVDVITPDSQPHAPPKQPKMPEPPPRETAEPLGIGPPVEVEHVPIRIEPDKLAIWRHNSVAGGPLFPVAGLVTDPDPIDGVLSWTIEARSHRGAVVCLAYSSDGQFLATGCADGTIRLWDLQTGELSRCLIWRHGFPFPGPAVKYVAWSPDAKYLVSASPMDSEWRPLGASGWTGETAARIWDVESGLLIHVTGIWPCVGSLAWSPDGTTLAIVSEFSLRLFNFLSGEDRLVKDLPVGGEKRWSAMPLCWSPDGRLLAFGGTRCRNADGAEEVRSAFCVVDPESGQVREVIDGLSPYLSTIAWSPDGKMIASTSAIQETEVAVQLWDPETGELRRTLAAQRHGARTLIWPRDGRALITLGTEADSTVRAWDLETGRLLYGREHPNSGLCTFCSLTCSSDGRELAAGDTLGVGHRLTTDTGEPLSELPASTGAIQKVAFSPEGKCLASANRDGTVRLWSIASREPLGTLRTGALVRHLAWSTDGRQLATAPVPGEVSVWDISSGEIVHTLPTGTRTSLSGLAWSPDGTTIATGTSAGIRLWDAISGQPGQRIVGPVHCLAWSPDSRSIAAITKETEIQLYDVASARALQRVSVPRIIPPYLLAWSPDGTQVAFWTDADERRLHLLDVKSGDLIRMSEEGEENEEENLCSYTSMQWLSKDRRRLAAGFRMFNQGSEGVAIWDTGLRRLLQKFPGQAAAFSPDGRMCASRGESMIRLRSLEDGRVLFTIVSLRDDQYAIISSEGHFRGSPGVEKEFVYVVQTEDGQETLTPEEFVHVYGWRNDPEKVYPASSPPSPDARAVQDLAE